MVCGPYIQQRNLPKNYVKLSSTRRRLPLFRFKMCYTSIHFSSNNGMHTALQPLPFINLVHQNGSQGVLLRIRMNETRFFCVWKIHRQRLPHGAIHRTKWFLKLLVHTNFATYIVNWWSGVAICKNPRTNSWLKERNNKMDRSYFFDRGKWASRIRIIISRSDSTPWSDRM